jgi:hypothetical protein
MIKINVEQINFLFFSFSDIFSFGFLLYGKMHLQVDLNHNLKKILL